jgi:hypothetical protein
LGYHADTFTPYWVSVNEPYLQPLDNGLTNVLVAHAKLYDWYKNEVRTDQEAFFSTLEQTSLIRSDRAEEEIS